MHAIGEHFIIGFDGTKVTPVLRKLIQKYHVGGVVLFRRNIESPRQVRELTARLHAISRRPLFVCVDQEGGRVIRLGPPFTQFPPMAIVGRTYRRHRDWRTVVELGRVMGRELASVGINWNFAPVVDVHSNPRNPIIGDRSFGPDPKVVSRAAEGLMRGLHAEGVLSCAKHFPGHGATTKDSHLDLPLVKAAGRLLWKRDISPYRRLIKEGVLKTVMTAHVLYPELDENRCATLSRPILTELLRGRLRFRGLIVSDDLLMKAIADRYGIPEASVEFFGAGGDLALICRDADAQMAAIELAHRQATRDKALQKHFLASLKRIRRIRSRFFVAEQPPLEVIGCQDHRQILQKIRG